LGGMLVTAVVITAVAPVRVDEHGCLPKHGPAVTGAVPEPRSTRLTRFKLVAFIMAAFASSPPPRRKIRAPSRQAAPEPPPRRSARLASGSKPPSRLPTPAHGAEHPSFIREDVTVGSMEVDEDTLQPTERGLRQDTVFAKSEEMVVTFHGHLPTEVKHVLRNAGEHSSHFPS